MKTSTFAASITLAFGLALGAAACRSDSSSTTTEGVPRDGGTGTPIGVVHDTPNVVGTITYPGYGGVAVEITVDNTPPAGWEVDSARAWVKHDTGSPIPDSARGNPAIASPELPFSGTPVPPTWNGFAYMEGLESPVWVLIEITLRNGTMTKKHLHKASYSANSGLVSIPFVKSVP